MGQRDKDKYNTYQREYQLERYHRRREKAIKQLGGKCSQCESTDNLEIDHIDPKEKSFSISKLWSISKKRFDAELSKCQLLCKEHHTIKSIYEEGKLPAKNTDRHGTLSMYRYCKCDLCRKEHNAYCAKLKRDKRRKTKK
jgi:hypothetical protein